MPGRAGSL